MPHICRVCSKTNPKEAAYCFFDGRPLLKDLDEGPLRMGSMPFPMPFYFSDGQACSNFNELVLACENHWDEARDVLAGGMWPMFFGSIGRIDLVAAANHAAAEPDRDHGLAQLLEKLPADPDFLCPPKLAVQPLDVNLGRIAPGGDRMFELVLSNEGMLLLEGVAWTKCDWLVFGDRWGPTEKMFQTRHPYVLTVYVLGNKLHAGNMPLQAEIVIETNGGTLRIPVRAEVPIRPFPQGVYANDSLAGAMSPRDIALKAKASLNEAAVLFEQGAVKAWYESNGWTYPIEGSLGVGKSAVQQFLEAIGLTKPPKLEIHTTSLKFRGGVGANLLASVTVSTKEQRFVYAQATSNQDWIKFRPTTQLGNKVKIVVEVTVPPFPGQTVPAQVTIRGNGNQQFMVPVSVMVDEAEDDDDEEKETSPLAAMFRGLLLGVGGLVGVLILVSLFVLFANRSAPEPEPPPIDPNPPIGKLDTPQQIFGVVRKAYADRDYKKFSNYLTDDSRDVLIGSFVLWTSLLKKSQKYNFMFGEQPPLLKVVDQHMQAQGWKNTESILQNLAPKQAGDEEAKKTLIALAQPIRNKRLFLHEVLTAVHANLLNTKTEIIGGDGELRGLEIQDDQATAQVLDFEGNAQPVAFRKVLGEWRIDFPDTLLLFRSLSEFADFQNAGSQITLLEMKNDPINCTGQLCFYNSLDQVSKKPCQIYELRMLKGHTYVLDLETKDFKPYLRLDDSIERPQTPDSDEGDAHIRFTAPRTGNYRIIASSFDQIGKFALKIRYEFKNFTEQFRTGDARFGNWLVCNQGNTIILVEKKSRQALQLVTSASDQVRYHNADGKAYLLYAGDSGDKEDISFFKMNDYLNRNPAKELALGVYQLDGWKVTVSNDRLEFQPAGVSGKGYLIIPRLSHQFNYSGRSYGSANVAVDAERLPWKKPDEFPGAVPGDFSSSSSAEKFAQLQASDPPDRVSKNPCRVYLLDMKQGETYVIKMQSSHFQPLLRVEDADGKEVARPGKTDLASEIRFEAPTSGDYRIIATKIGPATGLFHLRVQLEPQQRIGNNKNGANYFFKNGARFGNWSIWAWSVKNRTDAAFVLINRKTGEGVYLNWNSQGWVHYGDGGGWYRLWEGAKQNQKNSDYQRIVDNLQQKPLPIKRLANSTFQGGTWQMTVTDNYIEFRTTNRKGNLTIRPFSEGFTYNEQSYENDSEPDGKEAP